MDDDDGQAAVREERALANTAGAGTVLLGEGEAVQDVHRRVAAAKAWLDVAQQTHTAGRGGDAYEAARRGLAELGEDYADLDLDVEDDTGLKLAAAEYAHSEHAEYAPTAMMRVLEDRIGIVETGRALQRPASGE